MLGHTRARTRENVLIRNDRVMYSLRDPGKPVAVAVVVVVVVVGVVVDMFSDILLHTRARAHAGEVM